MLYKQKKLLNAAGKFLLNNNLNLSLNAITFEKLAYRCSKKQTHPSATRNSPPIADTLCAQVDHKTPNLRLLEIASGSGQHAGYLAPLLPNITFQPTEVNLGFFESINAYRQDCKTGNILPPLYLDVAQDISEWDERTRNKIQSNSYDYMFNSNMMHITPWKCSVGLFRVAGQMLKPGGRMFTYGPYAIDGVLTPQSNIDFDMTLKSNNPDYGIRDISILKDIAKENDIELQRLENLPSNNKLLTWIKRIAE